MIRSPLPWVVGGLLGLLLLGSASFLQAQRGRQPLEPGPADSLSQILGCPTDSSATLSVLSKESGNGYIIRKKSQ
jgi:hypothetical protein